MENSIDLGKIMGRVVDGKLTFLAYEKEVEENPDTKKEMWVILQNQDGKTIENYLSNPVLDENMIENYWCDKSGNIKARTEKERQADPDYLKNIQNAMPLQERIELLESVMLEMMGGG